MERNEPINLRVLLRESKKEKRFCEIHGDYEALVLTGHVSPCPFCLEASLAEEANTLISVQKQENEDALARARIFRTGIPEKYLQKGFKNYRVNNDGQREVLECVQDYARDFPCQGKSLGLIGGTGTGKTHLACAAGMEILRRGYSVRFITALSLLREVKSTYAPNSPLKEIEVIDIFCAPDLLIIDDIGIKTESETDRSIIYEVVNRRNLDNKPMIYTSNLSLELLRESVGDRVLSRLCEGGSEVLLCQWADYRLGGQS